MVEWQATAGREILDTWRVLRGPNIRVSRLGNRTETALDDDIEPAKRSAQSVQRLVHAHRIARVHLIVQCVVVPQAQAGFLEEVVQ